MDLRFRSYFRELGCFTIVGRAAGLVLGGNFGSGVHFLPSGGVGFFSQLVHYFLFKGVAVCLYEDRGAVAFVVRVDVSGMFVTCLRFRLLFAGERGRIFRRSPIRRYTGLVGPYRFRADGLPRLRR